MGLKKRTGAKNLFQIDQIGWQNMIRIVHAETGQTLCRLGIAPGRLKLANVLEPGFRRFAIVSHA